MRARAAERVVLKVREAAERDWRVMREAERAGERRNDIAVDGRWRSEVMV